MQRTNFPLGINKSVYLLYIYIFVTNIYSWTKELETLLKEAFRLALLCEALRWHSLSYFYGYAQSCHSDSLQRGCGCRVMEGFHQPASSSSSSQYLLLSLLSLPPPLPLSTCCSSSSPSSSSPSVPAALPPLPPPPLSTCCSALLPEGVVSSRLTRLQLEIRLLLPQPQQLHAHLLHLEAERRPRDHETCDMRPWDMWPWDHETMRHVTMRHVTWDHETCDHVTMSHVTTWPCDALVIASSFGVSCTSARTIRWRTHTHTHTWWTRASRLSSDCPCSRRAPSSSCSIWGQQQQRRRRDDTWRSSRLANCV